MHDQETKNQTKVQKETNLRMMQTPQHEYTLQSIHKLEQIRTSGTFPGTDNQTKTKNKKSQRSQHRKIHGDPIQTQHLFFSFNFKIKTRTKKAKWVLIRTEGINVKKRRYGHNAEIAI